MTISHSNTYVTRGGIQYRRHKNEKGVHWWTDPEDGKQQRVHPLGEKYLERAYQEAKESAPDLLALAEEIDEYLTGNAPSYVATGSILHQKIQKAIAKAGGQIDE